MIPPAWACVAKAWSAVEALVIRSQLEGTGLPFYTRNEGTQELIGTGALGGYNLVTGPIEFWVPRPLLEQAQALLHPPSADTPTDCPACAARVPVFLNTCPDCGLRLRP